MIDQDLERLARHYAGLLREHGDSPAAGQWSDLATQEARLQVLLEVADPHELTHARVLDFGCGTSHLLTMLQAGGFRGHYVGYDISEELVAHARAKFPGVRFEHRNVLEAGVPESFDYVFVSGVFNNKLADSWDFLTRLLRTLFARTEKALAFNNLSTYVDFFEPHLYYLAPEQVFRFCKEQLSPRVITRHDYEVRPGVLPYEFTTYVYTSPIACRPAAAPQ